MIVSEDTLTSAALNGDEDALDGLLCRHDAALRSRLAGKIAAKYRAAFDVDDVLQVTYLEAFLRIGQFRPTGAGSFLAWLSRIAEHNLQDAIRELDCAKRPPRNCQIDTRPDDESYFDLFTKLSGSITTASRCAARQEAKELLEAAIEKLPPDYRTAVRMYDLQGRSISQVSASLNRSAGAVHMLRARAHDRLVEILGESTQFFYERA